MYTVDIYQNGKLIKTRGKHSTKEKARGAILNLGMTYMYERCSFRIREINGT